jgi:hypothetical protein
MMAAKTCGLDAEFVSIVPEYWAKALLATVLGNIASHFKIEAVERRKARRKGQPKHMRQG